MQLVVRKKKVTPIKINEIPAIFANVSLSTLSEMNLPEYIAIIESKLSDLSPRRAPITQSFKTVSIIV